MQLTNISYHISYQRDKQDIQNKEISRTYRTRRQTGRTEQRDKQDIQNNETNRTTEQ